MNETKRKFIGYARVSTLDQNPQMQIDALVRYGVPADNIHSEKASGKTMNRPVLSRLIKTMPPDTTLVVWKLDRLGRTVMGVCETVEEMGNRGITLASVEDNIDTSTSMGRFIFHLYAAIAELERNLIAERTAEGMKRKMASGEWKPGRVAIIPNSPNMLAEFQRLYDSGVYERMTNKQVYEALQAADPKVKFTMRTYVKWKHDGHPGALLAHEPPLDLDD